MARGREIAAMNAVKEGFPNDAEQSTRMETLRCYEEAGKVQIRHFREYDTRTAFIHGHEVVSEPFGPSFPSETFMAHVALAVGAIEGYEGIPEKSTTLKRHEAQNKAAMEKRESNHVYDWSKDPEGFLPSTARRNK